MLSKIYWWYCTNMICFLKGRICQFTFVLMFSRYLANIHSNYSISEVIYLKPLKYNMREIPKSDILVRYNISYLVEVFSGSINPESDWIKLIMRRSSFKYAICPRNSLINLGLVPLFNPQNFTGLLWEKIEGRNTKCSAVSF